MSFFVVGWTEHNTCVLLSFSPTAKGWKQGSATPGYSYEYVKRESRAALRKWMRCDFVSHTEFDDEESATSFFLSQSESGKCPSFFDEEDAAADWSESA